ncbi:hypothetical protein DPX16_14646 [Anabarilius grahami]|uniref:Uncharacterized protein n=1 Tax=Anabarilius grahami TaxID=495550 RepID=A0A3N0XQH8_ANAGA|nr:hypothetical protein DPX16_14646 [Anabarilius grahami]
MDFRASGCASALHPSSFTGILFPSVSALVLAPSVVTPFCQAPVLASVPQSGGIALDFRACDVNPGYCLCGFAVISTSPSSASIHQPQGSVQESRQWSLTHPPPEPPPSLHRCIVYGARTHLAVCGSVDSSSEVESCTGWGVKVHASSSSFSSSSSCIPLQSPDTE